MMEGTLPLNKLFASDLTQRMMLVKKSNLFYNMIDLNKKHKIIICEMLITPYWLVVFTSKKVNNIT